MKEVVKVILRVVHVSSFCGLMLAGILGLMYEILGHRKFEQMLSVIGISKGFERTWIFGVIMLIALIVSHLIRAKLLTE